MATFLLFIPLTLLVLIFLQRNNSWRGAVLSAAIVLGFLLTAITEFLSLFNWLTFRGLFALWLTVSLILTFFYFKDVNKIKTDNISKATKLTPFSIFLLCSVVFIVAMLAIIALISPPNNSDSMVYHMSRVVHWIQDKNVAFYPTRILRQLHSNPWAEFAILHFQILSGGDRFANLVQWLSMIGSIIGVSLIAEQLGANQRGQVFAATFAATIPMGILQASTTQNDYVVAFWMVCFVYHLLLLRTKEMDGAIWLYSLRAGVSLGLAILTKATAYIYAFPFLFLYVVCQFKASRPKLLRPLIIILGFSFVINLGHYVRNFDLYGKPLGPGQEAPTGYKYSNDIFTMTSFVSNILRNIGLQIANTWCCQ